MISKLEPAECPHCQCKEIKVRVLAWWTFSGGEPVCQGDSYVEFPDDLHAYCPGCGRDTEIALKKDK